MSLPDAALGTAQQAIDIFSDLDQSESREAIIAKIDFQLARDKKGKHQEALEEIRKNFQALSIYTDKNDSGFVYVARKLAGLYRKLAHYQKADQILSTLHDHYQRDGMGRLTLADLKGDLCRNFRKQDMWLKARDYCSAALNLTIADVGSKHPKVARLQNTLAAIATMISDYKEAIALQNAALETYQRVLGENHSMTLSAYSNLSMIFSYSGDYVKARELAEKTLALRIEHFGEDDMQVFTLRNNLAMMLLQEREFARAIEIYEGMLGSVEKRFGAKHSLFQAIHANLAEGYIQTGRHKLAINLVNKLRNDKNLRPHIRPSFHISLLQRLGNAYTGLRDHKNAGIALVEAIERLESLYGKEDPTVATARVRLGETLLAQAKFAEAKAQYLLAKAFLRTDVKSEKIFLERLEKGLIACADKKRSVL